MRFRSSSRPIRILLIGEVVGYAAAIVAYVWFALPSAGGQVQWFHVTFFALVAAFPICANLLHGDRPADSGLRLDNLRASVRQVAPVTLVFAMAVAAVGLAAGGFHWSSWKRLGELAGLYLLWGLAQQYLLQAFALRRLCQAALPPPLAI
ncbi:MAG: hypothetical protein KAU28_10680, partial [Phycisphaerae bacterium]|nr:hypothetical protein [Phycisphaerae bacterium]